MIYPYERRPVEESSYAFMHIASRASVTCFSLNPSMDIIFRGHFKAMLEPHNTLSPFPWNILSTVFLKLPISVVEGANLSCLQPPGDAVEVESML